MSDWVDELPQDEWPEGRDSELNERLERDRPVPGAHFRGTLGRRLASYGRPQPRPEDLERRIAVFAGAGGVLLLVGALSALGLGPLGA